MNRFIFLCFCLICAVTLAKVESRKGGSWRRPTAPISTGFRRDNGPCICDASMKNKTRPGHMGHGHPHGPTPTGHHGHVGPTHHGPRPTGHHHGHKGPRHHRPGGHHGHRPTGQQHPWQHMSVAALSVRPCVCRKQSERRLFVTFRMRKDWDEQLSDPTSKAFEKLNTYIIAKVTKALKKVKQFLNMKFTQGSIVVQFEVTSEVAKDGSNAENPEQTLRNAIENGEMKDMDIYSHSLAVRETYSGVKVGDWKSSKEDCESCSRHGHHRHRKHHHHHGDHHREHHVIRQTRTCVEIDLSCDGIPLTRNSTCEACPYITKCWGGWRRPITLACIISAVVVVLVIIIVLVKVKKSRSKYVKTSPSTESVKELAQHDELQLPVKVPLA